jgi:hypothetical protein
MSFTLATGAERAREEALTTASSTWRATTGTGRGASGHAAPAYSAGAVFATAAAAAARRRRRLRRPPSERRSGGACGGGAAIEIASLSLSPSSSSSSLSFISEMHMVITVVIVVVLMFISRGDVFPTSALNL